MKNLNIDCLNIRLRGVPLQDVRKCSADLGKELVLRFSQQKDFPKQLNGKRIENINAGVVKIACGNQPTELRRIIAHRTARTIGSIKVK